MADEATLEQESTDAPDEKEKPRKKRSWLMRTFWLALICFGLFVLFLPNLAAYAITRPEVQPLINQRIPGDLKVGYASLGWQSNVFLTDVNWVSDSKEQSVSIKAINSASPLWELVSGSHPLKFHLDGLHAKAVAPDPHVVMQSEFDLAAHLNTLLHTPLSELKNPVTVTFAESQFDVTNSSGEILQSWRPISGSYESNIDEKTKHMIKVSAPVAGTNSTAYTNFELAAGPDSSVGRDVASFQFDSVGQPLNTLAYYFPNPTELPPLTGKTNGVLSRDFARSFRLDLDSNLDAIADEQIGQLPGLHLQLVTDYSAETDQLNVPRLYAQAGQVEFDGTGQVDNATKEGNVKIGGALAGPSEKLLELLPDNIREELELEGVQLSKLQFEGPLKPAEGSGAFALPRFQISTDITWARAAAYGIVSENGELKAAIVGARVKLIPTYMPISGGFIRALPEFDTSTKPITMHIPDGVVIDKAQMTEEMCRGWFAYVSPVLANATSTTGEFSLSTKATSFPVGGIGESELAGTISIHDAKIGPGPMANEILGLIPQLQRILGQNQEAQRWLSIREHDVNFQIKDGRVYHDEFAFNVGDVRFSTTGSVGTDRTLAMLMTVYLPDEWFAGRPLLAVLQGDPIQIPIGGTIDQPLVDARPLAQWGAQIGVKAAGGFLDKLLNGDLQLPQRQPRRRPRR